MKTVGICFYFGHLSPAARLSTRLLAEQLDHVHIFSDDPGIVSDEGLSVHPISISDFQKRVSEALKTSFALRSPYKLCDLKPFWPLLSRLDLADDDLAFWFDVDCLWGSALQTYLTPMSPPAQFVIGDRGHFSGMTFGMARILPQLLDQYAARKHWLAPIVHERHFAFDEFRYFHILLERMEKDNTIRWNRSVSRAAIDLDYWSARPRCSTRGLALSHLSLIPDHRRHTLIARFAGGSNQHAVSIPYVHFQKRIIDCGGADIAKRIAIDFRSDGSACFSPNPDYHRSFFEMSWRTRMMWKRFTAKMTAEALPWQHTHL